MMKMNLILFSSFLSLQSEETNSPRLPSGEVEELRGEEEQEEEGDGGTVEELMSSWNWNLFWRSEGGRGGCHRETVDLAPPQVLVGGGAYI